MDRTSIYTFKFYLSWLASCLLLFFSVFLLVLAFHISPTDAQCIRHNFVWSPALDKIKYHWETFPDYNLFNESKYFALSPTQEIEDLWEKVQLAHPISIPSDKLELLNQSYPAYHEDWVRNPEDSNAILAIPEYAAQLGCLNFLRQWTFSPYRDYTYLASHQGDKKTLWKRSHQCLERLRQAFMCWADSGVILTYFLDNSASPRLHYDFGTYHYCRNFDEIEDWTKVNAVQSVTMQSLWWSGAEDVLCDTFNWCF